MNDIQEAIMQSEDSNDSNRKQGRWTALEHQIYKDFFQTNPQIKKGNRIFKKLSDLIGTRTPSQYLTIKSLSRQLRLDQGLNNIQDTFSQRTEKKIQRQNHHDILYQILFFLNDIQTQYFQEIPDDLDLEFVNFQNIIRFFINREDINFFIQYTQKLEMFLRAIRFYHQSLKPPPSPLGGMGIKINEEQMEKLLNPIGFLNDQEQKEVQEAINNAKELKALMEKHKLKQEKQPENIQNKIKGQNSTLPPEVGFKVIGLEPTRYGDWIGRGRLTDF
ncbi:hypothetical protein pb186bvf_009855 [Paramecium bursaria]